MKFSLFVHMERLTSEQSHQQLYEEYIELCTLADRSGLIYPIARAMYGWARRRLSHPSGILSSWQVRSQ